MADPDLTIATGVFSYPGGYVARRALCRFPIFPVYGSGDYPVQPVYAEDLAAQAVEAGSQSENSIRRRGRARDALLRGAAPAAGLPDGRPRAAGLHAPTGAPRPD